MSDDKNLVKNLKEFLAYCQSMPQESVDQELRTLGFDPAKIAEKGKNLANELYLAKIQEQRSRIKEERLAVQAKAAAFLKQFALDSLEKVNEAIDAIRQGKLGGEAQRYAQAYFKNFQKATLEDKVSLLKDIELLKHLSQEE